MQQAADLLMLQFLAWLAEGPRTYAEVMEGWRSSCPRLSIWEDAVLGGLLRIEGVGTKSQSRVVLSARGRAKLVAATGAVAPARRELISADGQ
jgi:hypothetical protein